MTLFVLCRSDNGDGGWSLHAPGTTDDDVREGRGLLVSGPAEWDGETGTWSRPNERDYQIAEEVYQGEPAKFSVGDRVQAGWPGTEDYDTGRVIQIDDEHPRLSEIRYLVGWDTCVATWLSESDLRYAD